MAFTGSHIQSLRTDPAVAAAQPVHRVRRGVIGVLQKADELLLIQRADGIRKGGHWCFPGGHVEPGENSRTALRRELAEELGIEITSASRLGAVQLRDSHYVLAVWLASYAGGPFQLREGEVADAQWLTPSAVRCLPLGLPSNFSVLTMLGV